MDQGFGEIGGQSMDRWRAVRYALTDSNDGAVTKLQDQVRFAFILAGTAYFFPEKRDCIQPQNIGPLVGPEEDVIRRFDKDIWVVIIEIPLVGVEHRHHPLSHGLVPCEVARGGLRKDLRHGLLVHVGYFPVREDVVVVLVPLVACARRLGPRVFIRCVVQHHVQGQKHVAPAHPSRQFAQLLQSAVTGVDVAEIAHRVTAVTGPLGALEDRHDMHHVHAEFLKVGQLFPQALEVARYCRQWGMRYEEILASDRYFRRLAEIIEDPDKIDDEFVIVPPGGINRQELFWEYAVSASEKSKKEMGSCE